MKAGGVAYLGVVVLSLLAAICLASAPHEALAAHNAASEPARSLCP